MGTKLSDSAAKGRLRSLLIGENAFILLCQRKNVAGVNRCGCGPSLMFSHLSVTNLILHDRLALIVAPCSTSSPPQVVLWARLRASSPFPITLWLLTWPLPAAHFVCLTAVANLCQGSLLCSVPIVIPKPFSQSCSFSHSSHTMTHDPRGTQGAFKVLEGTPWTMGCLSSQVQTHPEETSDASPIAFPSFY